MFETSLLFAQTLVLAGMTGWLMTGLRDNLLHPQHNESLTAEVLSMARLRDGFPAAFRDVAHRAVTNRARQRMAFRLIVLSEALIALLLSAATIAMLCACIGWLPLDPARALAVLGAAGFATIWAGMLIGGNYFCYWFGHEGAQNTHFQLTIWGIAGAIFLAL